MNLLIKNVTLLNLLVFAHTFLLGANHVVQVGEKIQDKVVGAASGDVVIIRGGTFPEQDVNVTQPIRLVRRKGRM